jgi:hypothetical protein
MVKLALLLANLFGTFFGWFSGFLASKVAIVASVVAASLLLVVALFIAMKALTVGLVALVPYESFRMAFWACWPSNAETCVAACWGADIAVFLYRFRIRLLALVSR